MELHVQLDLTASRILFVFHFTSGEVLYPGNGNDTFHSQHFPDLKDYRKNCKRRVHWHSTGYHLPYYSNHYSDSCYIPRSSNTYHQNWPFALCPSNWHRSETTAFANLVSYLKAFSDQKDPLETRIPWSINSRTSSPWQKTAARKFFPFSLNSKQHFCSETIQISSSCSQGNYKTYSQILWSEYFQCWSRRSNEGWAPFPLPVGWTRTQQFFLDHLTG